MVVCKTIETCFKNIVTRKANQNGEGQFRHFLIDKFGVKNKCFDT